MDPLLELDSYLLNEADPDPAMLRGKETVTSSL
jgi:hypothetical protein